MESAIMQGNHQPTRGSFPYFPLQLPFEWPRRSQCPDLEADPGRNKAIDLRRRLLAMEKYGEGRQASA